MIRTGVMDTCSSWPVVFRCAAPLVACVLSALSTLACSSSSAEAPASPEGGTGSAEGGAAPSATITGPITGGCTGKPFPSAPLNLSSYGYVEQEYFLAGNATAYKSVNPPGPDGMWYVTPMTTAHYKTRLLVRRPTDPMKFNGTVIVEWLNVTAGVDLDPDFGYAHVELLRSGYGYVGVSAQAAGVVGGAPNILGISAAPLVQVDPQRYGSLEHPGDDYSYDIFTQAARALRNPSAVDPLGGLAPARLIADGESQSAFRMVTYVNAIQPIAKTFDGFFIHSRFGNGALISGSANAGSLGLLSGPSPARIRGDLAVPVFQFETETDVLGPVGQQGFSVSRQPDTDLLRTWEVAGTAHADRYLNDYEAPAYAGLSACAGDAGADSGAGGLDVTIVSSCGMVNAGPEHWVEDAAVSALNAWVKDRQLPPTAPPLTLAADGNGFAHDANGNALGGVRSPAVDVPTAMYSGQPPTGASLVCSLFGQTTPFSATRLMTLYPDHADYVSQVTAAATQDQKAGFFLAADVPLIEQEAQSAPVPQ